MNLRAATLLLVGAAALAPSVAAAQSWGGVTISVGRGGYGASPYGYGYGSPYGYGYRYGSPYDYRYDPRYNDYRDTYRHRRDHLEFQPDSAELSNANWRFADASSPRTVF